MGVDPERMREIDTKATELLDRAEGDPRRLAVIAAQYWAHVHETTGGEMEVVGIVTLEGEPMVQTAWGHQRGQLSPDDCREHAMLMLEAAENAVHDAAIYKFFTEEMDLDKSRAAHALDAIRTFRRDKWGQPEKYEMKAKVSDESS